MYTKIILYVFSKINQYDLSGFYEALFGDDSIYFLKDMFFKYSQVHCFLFIYLFLEFFTACNLSPLGHSSF